MSNPEVPELRIPAGHCGPCPTAASIEHGHDPESYDYLRLEAFVNDPEIDHLWCPWRKANCVVYPVELEWARECFRRGIVPPIRLHPCFQEQGGRSLPPLKR